MAGKWLLGAANADHPEEVSGSDPVLRRAHPGAGVVSALTGDGVAELREGSRLRSMTAVVAG